MAEVAQILGHRLFLIKFSEFVPCKTLAVLTNELTASSVNELLASWLSEYNEAPSTGSQSTNMLQLCTEIVKLRKQFEFQLLQVDISY